MENLSSQEKHLSRLLFSYSISVDVGSVSLIVPSFPHTLHTSQHVLLFSASTSETELRPQLHVLLHFPRRHDLTRGQLCLWDCYSDVLNADRLESFDLIGAAGRVVLSRYVNVLLNLNSG